jgi:endonuclease/exonuclease/phosphatase (EEP) superfamily protein YafD
MSLGIAAGVLGWVLALIVGAGALSTAMSSTPNSLFAAVQGASPRLVVLGALLGVVLTVVGRELEHTFLPGVVLLAGTLAWTIQLLPVAEVAGTAGQDGIRLLSTNLLITNEDTKSIAADLTAVNADVLVTLETGLHTRESLATHLPSYRIVSTGEGARGLWASVWVHERVLTNVLSERRLRVGGETLPGIEYRLGESAEKGSAATTIHIVGVHLHSPSSGDDADGWREELKDLTRHAGAEGSNLVLAGDFNAGRAHPVFAPLLEIVRDAGRTTWGTGTPTWPVFGRGEGSYRWFFPSLDLDHILTGKHLAATRYRSVSIHGSDHLGVVAEIVTRTTEHSISPGTTGSPGRAAGGAPD